MKECTTHHNACDCREAKFARLETKLVEAESHIRALIEQAIGCAENHYPGEPEIVYGQHICGAQAFLDTPGKPDDGGAK